MEVEFLVNISALSFLLFLAIVYFTKKNALNIENKIYRIMLIANILFLIFQILTKFVYEWNEDYYLPFSNIPIAIIVVWILLFGYYLIIVSNEKNKKFMDYFTRNQKNINRLVAMFMIIMAFIVLFLPSSIIYNENHEVIGIIGPNTYFMYGSLAISILSAAYSIIKNRKNLNKKKLAPFLAIFAFIFIMLIFISTVEVNPGIYLLFSLITYFMYHTIENPDIKMIAQLEFAKNQAEKSNKAKTDFLSSMSHEIRTPLNAIVGLSQMIKESNDISRIHEDTNDIIFASQNLLEIVNGILDINKLEANEMEINEENYNPREVFESLVKLMYIRIGEKPLELRTNFSNDIPKTLYGDKEKVKQIITNLLTNAIKYTEKGFVDFNVSCQNIKDKCELTITVKDTGRGMKEEQMAKLFTKFNRLEEDKDSNIEGTGLGLAITKSLVELFDGKITAESIYGQGSTFQVVLKQKIIEYNVENSIKSEVPQLENSNTNVILDNNENIDII